MESVLSKNLRYWFGKRCNYQASSAEVSALTAAHLALMTEHPISSGKLIHARTGTHVAKRWNRIVVGAHGPYVEFTHYQDFFSKLIIPEDQLWRAEDKRYKDRVKYVHYELSTVPGMKVYFQRKPVVYADYRPDGFYIDLYELVNE